MFTKSAQLYDAIYGWKDYKAESLRLIEIIGANKKSSGNDLLDVACGTGGHIPYLSEVFRVEGLDLDPGMLDIARAKYRDVPIHAGDMVDFDLGRQFDVVVSLFSSVGYLKTPERLTLGRAQHGAPRAARGCPDHRALFRPASVEAADKRARGEHS